METTGTAVVAVDINSILADLHRTSKTIDGMELELKNVEKEYQRLEVSVVEYMEEQGLKTITNKDGSSVTLPDPTLRASVNKEKSEEALKWLGENGYDYAVKPSIKAGTLSRILTERIKTGDHIPHELFNQYFQKTLRVSSK